MSNGRVVRPLRRLSVPRRPLHVVEFGDARGRADRTTGMMVRGEAEEFFDEFGRRCLAETGTVDYWDWEKGAVVRARVRRVVDGARNVVQEHFDGRQDVSIGAPSAGMGAVGVRPGT